MKHDSKAASSILVSFSSSQVISGQQEYHRYKTHGNLASFDCC